MKLFSSGILSLIAITAFAPLARATPFYWQGGVGLNTSNGSTSTDGSDLFNDNTNWSTVPPNASLSGGQNGVPGPSDIAIIQADVNNGSVIYQSVNLAIVSLNTPGPVVVNSTESNTVNGLIITNYGFVGVGSGVINFNSPVGTFTVNGSHARGGDFVVDGGTTLNYVGGPLVVKNGTIVIGDVETFTTSALLTEGGSGTFNLKFGNFSYDGAANSTSMIVGNNLGNGSIFVVGGAVGTVTQGAPASTGSSALASTATLGSSLILGYDGGTGAWNVTNKSILNTGSQASSYLIALGSNGGTGGDIGAGSVGSINISGGSVFNLGFANAAMPVDLQAGTTSAGAGAVTGGEGDISESGATSVVNIAGTNTSVELGAAIGGLGTYNFQNGTLNIGINTTDNVTFVIGAGGTGSLSQSNGTMNVGNSTVVNGTIFVVGGGGTGTYTISGGTANFNNQLALDAGGTLNLNGGTLNIGADNFVGTGELDFGGGTLNLTSGTTFTDNFAGGTLATGTNTTINASTGAFTSVAINQNLTGSGSITFIGTTNTVFTFNGTVGGVGLMGGVLDITGDNIANASFLTINSNGASPGVVNLALGATDLAFGGILSGNGTLQVNFNAPGETLSLNSLSNATSNLTIVLAANSGPDASLTPGTFTVLSGAFGDIDEVGTGNNVMVGGPAGTGLVTIAHGNYTGLTTVFQNFQLNAITLAGSAAVGSVALPGGILNVTGASVTGLGIGGDVTNDGGIVNVPNGGIGGNVVNDNEPTMTGTSVAILNVGGATGIAGNLDNTGVAFTPLVGGNVTNSGTITFSSATNTVGGNLTNNAGGFISTTAVPFPVAVNTPNFTIGGTLTNTGTLNVRLDGTVADQYAATGPAHLDGGTINIQVLRGGVIGTTLFDIVTGSSVTDAGIILSPDTALFTYTVQNLGTAEQLTVVQAPTSMYAQTPNQLAVANSLDGSNSPLFMYFALVPLNAGSTLIPEYLDELTPASLQYARNIAFENANFLAQRMNNVDADLRAGYGGLDTNAISVTAPGFNNSLGRGLGNFFASNDAFHQTAPNGVNYYPGGQSSANATEAAGPAPIYDTSSQVMSDTPSPYLASEYPNNPVAPNVNEFIGGDVVLADLNQNDNINSTHSKVSYTAGDAVAGVAFRVNSHFTAGVLFDYNHTDADTDSNGSKITVDSYMPGVFATFADHGFYANGLAAFGYNDYSNTRAIPFANETAASSPNGMEYIGDLDGGYDFHPDKSWVVGPTLGATYTHLDIDSFSESGAPGADLNVDSQSVDSLRSRLGAHATYQTNTGDVLLQPNLAIMWQHEYLADSDLIHSSFNDFTANPFDTRTAAPSRDSALISLGLTATLSNSMALYLSYLADVGADDYWAQSVVGGFKARF